MSAYDRLGIRQSNDGVNFENVSVSWMQRMASTSPNWGNKFNGDDWNSSESISDGTNKGWVVPKDPIRATLITALTPESDDTKKAVTINARYVKFYFYSDSNTTYSGWNIKLTSSNPRTGEDTFPATIGNPLYIDKTDYTRCTEESGGPAVGYVAATDGTNNSLFMRFQK